HDHHKNGWMTFAQVLQRSSNIGMIKVAQQLAPAKLAWYLYAFGFGQKTDVDLTGEQRGLTKELHEWGRRTRASIAIGQEIGVTPLQLVMAVAAIANGGWLMRPYVVSEVRSSTGETVARFEPVVRRRPISTKTAKDLTEIMRGAVLPGGTGMLGAVPGYDVAGKTGTAQKIDPLTGAYSATRMVSSFVGFLPADDPKLAILVAVKGTQSDGHRFLAQAVAAGAGAIVVETGRVSGETLASIGIPVIQVGDSRRALGLLASRFYGDPSRRLKMIGVTGTNGKTTA